jgi:hypothetical protein
MTKHEERAELMRLAAELSSVLKDVTRPVHLVINKLVEAADSLAIDAADEKAHNEHVTVRRLVHTKTERIDTKQPNLTPPPGRGKRACSICRQTGHRAQNCPQADAHFKSQRGKK